MLCEKRSKKRKQQLKVMSLFIFFSVRHTVFILIGVLSLLDALLLIIAVVMGLCGSSSYDTPSSRSNVSHKGGKLMLGLVVGAFN